MLVLKSESFFLKAKSLAFVTVSYWCPLVLYLELDINDMILEKAVKYYIIILIYKASPLINLYVSLIVYKMQLY